MKKIYILFLFALIANTSFSQVSSTIYSVSGVYTFTVPAGITSLTIEAIGAGGRGQGNGTGGGGGGAYASGIFSATPGATLAVKVGTPGVNQTQGTSSVTGYVIATGGANGVSVPNPNVGGGGAGGVATGGTTNNNGGTGGGGYYTYFGGGGGGAGGMISAGGNGGNCTAYTGSNCLQPGGAAGVGGGFPGGNGGKGAGFTNASCSITDPAGNGGMFGGGGGGGNGIGSTPGAGGGGAVRIAWPTITGINGHDSKSTVSIFPNPFSTKINIQNSIGNETFELVNALGQQIFSGKNIEEQDLSSLSKGIYFLKIQNTNSVIKLIKQ
jgi:hypothetical protein